MQSRPTIILLVSRLSMNTIILFKYNSSPARYVRSNDNVWPSGFFLILGLFYR